MVAQVVHAAGESSPGNLKSGTYAVALAACDEQELHRVARSLEEAQVPFKAITENAGRYKGQVMAIGVVPGPKREVGRCLGSLPLVRESSLEV